MAWPFLSFEIASQWDGKLITHPPVTIKLSQQGGGNSIILEVTAPFHNDPPPPGPAGHPQETLWDFEVVEAFFLGTDEKYLEVELCPHGQHLVLLLDGVRNIIKDRLPLEFVATIQDDKTSWCGRATIPLEYVPQGLRRFNAYAIHGTGADRQYEALYPAEAGKHPNPDFHRLEYFREVDWTGITDLSRLPTTSSVWK